MKHLTLLFLLTFSIFNSPLYSQVLDCYDYTLDSPNDDFPGFYGVGDHTFTFSGETQIVTLGIYGFFNDQQEDQTFFSVNGSTALSLVDIGTSITVDGVSIMLDQTDAGAQLEADYLANASNSFNGLVYHFQGAIETITMTQFESGLVYSCAQPLSTIYGCIDYFEGAETIADGPTGYIVDGTYSFAFNGEEQTVDLGYYDYVTWEQQEGDVSGDATYFSVNGSESIALGIILADLPYTLNGVTITIDQTPLDAEYNILSSMVSGTISFTGEIEFITTQQVESGLVFICTDGSFLTEDCIDHTEGGTVYQGGGYEFGYDGSEQSISIGLMTFYEWDEPFGSGYMADETLISINGSEAVTLADLYFDGAVNVAGVDVSLDTTTLPAPYDDLVNSVSQTGTILISGEVESISLFFAEAALLFDCGGVPQDDQEDCIDHTAGGTILNTFDAELGYDGSDQEVSIGLAVYFYWEDIVGTGNVAEYSELTVNGSAPFNLSEIYQNQPFAIGDVVLTIDTAALGEPYSSYTTSLSEATIYMTGAVEQVTVGLVESVLMFSCTEEIGVQEDCEDFVSETDPPGFPGIYVGVGDVDLDYDGSDQVVSLGIYGLFNDWNSGLGQADQTFFSVNGGEPISLETIFNDMPLQIGDILISLDTSDVEDEFGVIPDWATTGTVIFTGEIDQIVMTQFESGLLFSCTEEVEEVDEDCEDYTVDGIPQFDQTPSLSFGGTHQEISVGIYGYYDWSDIYGPQSLAESCFFSLDNGPQIAMDSLYLNMPLTYSGITISLDTNSLNSEYNVPSYLGSGTIIFTGEVSQIDFSFVEEAGLLFACKQAADPAACECGVDADFSYINLGTYYSFVSSGTGTEYQWDFGDDFTSEEENPTHDYPAPGDYEVCMTNYDLDDTCSVTVCQMITVEINTPGVHIITPDGDGVDDLEELNCGDVSIYDRHGARVALLQGETYWDGRNDAGAPLPMGEYILRCNADERITKVTILR